MNVRRRRTKTLLGESQKRSGFALIVTVSLLSLLVLVLVALASLTRIESSIGRNSLHFAEARQNALFALDIAMGELQRHAGPDQRVTARSDIALATIENRHWTGVWNSEGGFRTWLVSANENLPNAGAPATDVVPNFGPTNARQQQPPGTSTWEAITTLATPQHRFRFNDGLDTPAALLVGGVTAGALTGSQTRYVLAPLIDLTSPAPGGVGGNVTTGRYAWWVGDEGIKASISLEDLLEEVDYGPYAFDAVRSRLRQQVPLTHQTFRGTDGSGGSPFGFDPAAASNASGIEDIVARSQLRFLSSDSAPNSFTNFLRGGFHDFTTVSYGVMANTRTDGNRGLKRDLSVDSSLLGAGFAAWQNYDPSSGGHMEDPTVAGANPAIVSQASPRRRHTMTSPINNSSGDIAFSIAPVVTELIMQFGVRRSGANTLEVFVRSCVALWNPYTSGLVPESLVVEISGLPTINLVVAGAPVGPINLQDVLGSPYSLNLPFSGAGLGTPQDRASMLPGRVYYWRNPPAYIANPVSNDLLFYAKGLSQADGWSYSSSIALPVGSITEVESVSTPPLSVTLKNVSGDELDRVGGLQMTDLWNVLIPDDGIPSSDQNFWRFGIGFRLNQPAVVDSSGTDVFDFGPWSAANAIDPRQSVEDPLELIPFNLDFGFGPPAYGGEIVTDFNYVNTLRGNILNRSTAVPGGTFDDWYTTYDNDTPIFELPRLPILSLGMLQHLRVVGQRPFAIGNSFASGEALPGTSGGGTIGSLFDRFFFSGVSSLGPSIEDGEPFPWFHLRVFDPTRSLDSATFSSAANATTSRYLLNAGAFNINSTSVAAWEAVLKSLRPPAPGDWLVADLGTDGGSQVDSDDALDVVDDLDVEDLTQGETGEVAARPFGFFRFSHTAQETFETDDTVTVSGFNRSGFRQGFRGGSTGTDEQTARNLTSTQVETLAEEIVDNIREAGPFSSMEEFVSPANLTNRSDLSVLEEAIDVSGINASIPAQGMSSYFLTQADVLTALAPMLQNRSDTFVIRTYGETVNPVTNAVEGRAWCEATVQRIPTTVASADNIEQPTGLFGRRFQIVSFRWLTPDDI